MLDFAWSEFLVVIIVAVIVIGPKQLPEVLYGFGRIVRRLQYLRFAMSKQFEDFMEQADLNEIRNLKKTSFDSALHTGVDEEDMEQERRLDPVIARNEVTKQSSDGNIDEKSSHLHDDK